MYLEASILVRRPPSEVWAFLENPFNLPRWDRSVKRVVVTSAAPAGVGCTFDTFGPSTKTDGARSSYLVTEYRSGEYVWVDLINSRLFSRARWLTAIQSCPDGTNVRIGLDLTPRIRYCYLWPVFRFMAHRIKRDLVHLKAAIESSRPAMPAASRASWKTAELPSQRADLGFHETFSGVEFETIQRGWIPIEMEDKWFILFEDPWLFLHRSWTGVCIYMLRFERHSAGASVVESWVNRDPTQYSQVDVDYDRALAKFVIDALLLGRQVRFPVSADAGHEPLTRAIFQHGVVGRTYPETIFEPPRRKPQFDDESARAHSRVDGR